MAYFELDIAQFQGTTKVVVEASGNGEKASFEVPIDVVNPNTPTTEVQDILLEAGSTTTINLETFGIAGSNVAEVEFSTLPPMNFNGRMKYLIHYPHGCVEQTTSAAFPQLYLGEIFSLTTDKSQKIQKHIEAAIRRLGNYQLPGGGFGYWPGGSQADDWGTSYAGHFLLEAEKKGYLMPIGFKASWIDYQQRLAKQWRDGQRRSDLAQAYRLYTLALSGNADVASMNRLRETTNLSNEAKFRLAAAYGLIGQKGVAEKLIRSSSVDFTRTKNNSYTYGSRIRNQAMALETLVLIEDKVKAQEMAKAVAEDLNSKRWLSTQSTAYGLLAMAKFAEMVGGKGIRASVSVSGAVQDLSSEKTLASRDLKIKRGANSIELTNKGSAILYATLTNTGILPVGEERSQERNLRVNVSYKGRNGSTIDHTSLSQGTNFIAEVSVTNTTSRSIKNMALSEIFPGGWEIVNTRFTDFGNFAENSATYTDLRDDRALFYFDLQGNETKTFRILLNASYLGRYYLPGVQAEAMYDNDYLTRKSGRWIQVIQ